MTVLTVGMLVPHLLRASIPEFELRLNRLGRRQAKQRGRVAQPQQQCELFPAGKPKQLLVTHVIWGLLLLHVIEVTITALHAMLRQQL